MEGIWMTDFWHELVVTAIRDLGHRIAAVLPGLLAMVTLVVLGALLGGVVRAILTRLARAVDFDRRSQTWGLTGALARAGVGRLPSQILGLLAFWGVFVIFATMGVEATGVPGTAGATGTVIQFIPRLVTAVLILVVGWLAANFAGQAVLIAAVNAGIPEARLVARAARWAVLLFAFATTLTHLGIGKDMIMVAFAATFGGVVLAFAIAFGLGGRGLAREILERRLRHRGEPHPRETLTHL
jgi:Conserved TM helix